MPAGQKAGEGSAVQPAGTRRLEELQHGTPPPVPHGIPETVKGFAESEISGDVEFSEIVPSNHVDDRLVRV